MNKQNEEIAEIPTVNIAYIMPSKNVSFWQWVLMGIQNQCNSNDWELIVYDSNNDPKLQLAHAIEAINKNVDGIIISPTDSYSCQRILAIAEQSDVPVVICDIGTESGNYLSYVSTPNYKGAFQAGEFVAQQLQDKGLTGGQIVEITIPLTRINGQERSFGFRDSLKKYDLTVAPPHYY